MPLDSTLTTRASPRAAWSVVIATRNRRSALLQTIRAIPATFEVLVVDNASDDGTADAVRAARPDAQVIALRRNLGPVAKSIALDRVSFPLVAALDDDAAPEPHTWDEMAHRFEADGALLCAGWGVRVPPTGAPDAHTARPSPYHGWDCSALPRVFAGAAAAFRADALRAVGGWDRRLFMQAEEYDLTFRLCALAGSAHAATVRFDLPAIHRKSPLARAHGRTLRLDARNNAILARRWLPQPWGALLGADWRARYAAFARLAGRPGAARRGHLEAFVFGGGSRAARAPLSDHLFDSLFGLSRLTDAMHALRASGVRRILLAPLGKNALLFDTAAKRAGLSIVAVADDRFADPRSGVAEYRGAPIRAGAAGFDAVVIADSAPIHAARAAALWRARVDVPVIAPDAIDLASLEHAGRAHGAPGSRRPDPRASLNPASTPACPAA